jgi:hypothetical protein
MTDAELADKHDKVLAAVCRELKEMREKYEKAEGAEAVEAIRHFFEPGPRIATPEYHEWPNGTRDDSEPDKKTWNEKLDRLRKAAGLL